MIRKTMKAALSVIALEKDHGANLDKVIRSIGEAAKNGSDFVFFAETVVSGLIPNDIASEMLPLGQEIPGAITSAISAACKTNNVWVSVGLLEREGARLYDSAVILSPTEGIRMKYRRISPRWHWPNSDPDVFCQGNTVEFAETPFGRFAALICGDLFDEEGQLQLVQNTGADFLAYPLAGGGDGWWDGSTMQEYSRQARRLGIPVFLVNYIAEDNEHHCGAAGGAAVFSGDGSILASYPSQQEGILYCSI